jgi:hypothetical protein
MSIKGKPAPDVYGMPHQNGGRQKYSGGQPPFESGSLK